MSEFNVDDNVKLPFGETGTIKKIHDFVWFKRYWVRIRKSNGFNKTNELVDFFEKNLELEN